MKDTDPVPDPYVMLMNLDPGGLKQTDPTEPDPQHWFQTWKRLVESK